MEFEARARHSAGLNRVATAVPQSLNPENTAIEWHFSQENATLHNAARAGELWNRSRSNGGNR
jgi:hypothetical protein